MKGDKFFSRDVRDYLGIEPDDLEVLIYYDNQYYKRSNRAGVLSAMKANGIEIKPNTFRNWVLDWNYEKLKEKKVLMEYCGEIVYEKPTGKYITTRGDVLNLNLSIRKFPSDKNEFILRIDGKNEVLQRGWLVFIKFIDRDIVDERDIYYINGRFEDCDIGNLCYKSDI